MRQKQIALEYKGKSIGPHRIDFLVEGKVVLEIKATEGMKKIFEATNPDIHESDEEKGRTTAQFQCRKTKGWNKEIRFVRGHRGGG